MAVASTRGDGVFERESYSNGAGSRAKSLRKSPSLGERKLWDELRKLDLNIRRQCPIGNYVADFVCHAAKLVVEVDGYHHTTAEGQVRDAARDEWFLNQGYRVIRFTDREASLDTERVAWEVREAITKALPPRGGKGWDGGGRTELSGEAGLGAEPVSDQPSAAACTPPPPALPPSRGKGELWRVLSEVPDPEVPAVSVVDLGIVRGVSDAEPPVVTITPTYTGCPATLAIEGSIRAALDRSGFGRAKIVTVLDPPWTTDWISDEGREKLRAYGIAPPPKGAAAHSLKADAAECPRCGSSHTQEVSRFGSTPCKAQWRCLDCAEPFDRFKCH